MNELQFSAGGRKFFNEDLVDLQDNLISMQSIFAGESPFILSGMEFTAVIGTVYAISEGYFWLNGKIRYFAPAGAIDVATLSYINVVDSDESTTYEDLVSKVSSTRYGYTHAPTSSGNESIDISVPAEIPRYFDNVLGDKYLLLNSSNVETIDSGVTFTSPVIANNSIAASSIYATDIELSGDLKVDGAIEIDGNMTVDGNLEVTGALGAQEYYINGIPYPVISGAGVAGSNVVSETSILNGSVTVDKIDNGAVTTDKIRGGAITNSKIGVGEIGLDKLNFNPLQLMFSLQLAVNLPLYAGVTDEFIVNHNQNITGNYFIVAQATDSNRPVSCNTFINVTPNTFSMHIYSEYDTSVTINVQLYRVG